MNAVNTNHRFNLLSCLVVMLCVFITSCASLTQETLPEKTEKEVFDPARQPADWGKEKAKRQRIDLWELRGRLGVQTATDGGSMDMIWIQSGKEFSIRLIAPLGAGTYLIHGSDDFAEVRYPSGKKTMVDDLDEIFVSSLNVKLPVSAIKDWIRGLPAAALPVERVRWNKQGFLHRIRQSGWNVEMTKYAGSKLAMPHAIYVTRDDDSALDIRLVLRQWLIDN